MIRYAVLTPSLAQPGGAERHIYALIRHADPARLRCVGVVLSGFGWADPDLAAAIRGMGVAIVGDPPRGRFWGPRPPGLVETPYRTLQQAVHETCRDAQVLVTWGSLMMARFTEGLGMPVVCVAHSSERANQPITGITHLVAVSRAATGHWAGIDHNLPVEVIPNGVEVEHCVPRRGRAWQRARWGLGARDIAIGYVGRHHPIKRPWACIRALPGLPGDFVAVLIGNQPNDHNAPDRALVELADGLGVAHRVHFVPRQAVMGDAYAALDCLMLASSREADSLTLKEAMICGLPACATRVGSVPEMEDEFGLGRVVEPITDPESDAHLSACALSAAGAAGAARADRMRRPAWDRWTAPAMADRWADYLEGIVDDRR